MIKVAAAVIIKDGRIMIAKRKEEDKLGGLWEFPGGKLEEEETIQECLKREIREEFDGEIEVGDFITVNQHSYPHISIELYAYYAFWLKGEFKPLEHQEVKWVLPEELEAYEFAPADITIVNTLINKKIKVKDKGI